MDVDLENRLLGLLEQIDGKLSTLLEGTNKAPDKQWYTPDELAAVMGRKPYTVREWCRLDRIPSEKNETGLRRIPAAEVERLRAGGAPAGRAAAAGLEGPDGSPYTSASASVARNRSAHGAFA